jgi:hypothetical protein
MFWLFHTLRLAEKRDNPVGWRQTDPRSYKFRRLLVHAFYQFELNVNGFDMVSWISFRYPNEEQVHLEEAKTDYDEECITNIAINYAFGTYQTTYFGTFPLGTKTGGTSVVTTWPRRKSCVWGPMFRHTYKIGGGSPFGVLEKC